jgi:hypothetical protein
MNRIKRDDSIAITSEIAGLWYAMSVFHNSTRDKGTFDELFAAFKRLRHARGIRHKYVYGRRGNPELMIDDMYRMLDDLDKRFTNPVIAISNNHRLSIER